jgi:hypothetical protein
MNVHEGSRQITERKEDMNEKCKGCRWQRDDGCVVQGLDDNPWKDPPCERAWLLCSGDDYEPIIPQDYKDAVDKLASEVRELGESYIDPFYSITAAKLTALHNNLAELEKVTK